VIAAVHTIIHAEDAEQARAFCRDVLELPAIDSGDGWLIFALPPGELALHPAPEAGAGQHELFLMCREIKATVEELERKGVEFVAPVSDEGWGLLTRFRIPGAGELGLYEPRHASPLAEFAGD